MIIKIDKKLILEDDQESQQEEVKPDPTSIGYIISYGLFLVAQTHMWHLVCPNAQQHISLQEFYEELQDEVDELAERYIAIGGQLVDINQPITSNYVPELVQQTLITYRDQITSAINTDPSQASIMDGIVDIQQLIDNKLYKFRLL